MAIRNRAKQLRNVNDATVVDSSDAQKAQNKRLLRSMDDEAYEQGQIIEVINDPRYFLDNVAEHYVEAGFLKYEPEEIRKLPINSLMVAIVGEKIGSKLQLVIPFTSSLISQVPKVGETVWLVDVEGDFKYWMARVGGFAVAEDPNLTDIDRAFTIPTEPPDEAKDKKKAENGDSDVEDSRPFWNNINKKISQIKSAAKDAKEKKKEEKEEKVESKYREYKTRNEVQLEPIPRFTPRQGDTFIQGSNNTLIVLGTDRGEPYGTELDTLEGDSSAHLLPNPNSGSIDIVVGRGAGESEPYEDQPKKEGKATGTMPRTIFNETGHVEVDKAPYAKGLEPNFREGDPLFEHDKSRVYISMNTNVDANFWPKEKYPPMYVEVSNDEDTNQQAAIALQTDQFRIYSRPEGEIRIVKQGDEQTQACIVLTTDGKVLITGEEIILGRKNEEGEPESYLNTEPYVRYSELHNYFEEFHSILSDLAKGLKNNRSPGHFATDVIIQQAAIQFMSAQDALKEKFENIKSERIFGE